MAGRYPGGMHPRIALVASLAVALHTAVASADPPSRSTVSVGGVRLAGEASSSSTGVRREPGYSLTNRTGSPRVVELVSLTGLGDGAPRALRIEGERRIVLAPGETRSLLIRFAGQPLNRGGGLSHYVFSLTIAVGGLRASAIATNSYVCRIPMRHLTVP